jgi:hypothetical protein
MYGKLSRHRSMKHRRGILLLAGVLLPIYGMCSSMSPFGPALRPGMVWEYTSLLKVRRVVLKAPFMTAMPEPHGTVSTCTALSGHQRVRRSTASMTSSMSIIDMETSFDEAADHTNLFV